METRLIDGSQAAQMQVCIRTLIQEADAFTPTGAAVSEAGTTTQNNRWLAGVFRSYIIVGPQAAPAWQDCGLTVMSMEKIIAIGARQLPGPVFHGLYSVAFHETVWEYFRQERGRDARQSALLSS